MLSFIDASIASSNAACIALANSLRKALVLNVSDQEKSLECLRKQEMFSNHKKNVVTA